MPVSSNQVAFEDAKKWSQRLKKSLKDQHPTVKLNECQNAVAQMLGFPHWHALAAQDIPPTLSPETSSSLKPSFLWQPDGPFGERQSYLSTLIDMPPDLAKVLTHWSSNLTAITWEWAPKAKEPVTFLAHQWATRARPVISLPPDLVQLFLRQLANLFLTDRPRFHEGNGFLIEGEVSRTTPYRFLFRHAQSSAVDLLTLKVQALDQRVHCTLEYFPAERLAQFQSPPTFERLGFDETRRQVSVLHHWTTLPHGLTLVISPPGHGGAFTLASVGARALEQHSTQFPQVCVKAETPVLEGLKSLGARLIHSLDEVVDRPPQLLILENPGSDEMLQALNHVACGVRVWAGVQASPDTLDLRLKQLGIHRDNYSVIHGTLFQQRVPMRHPKPDVTGLFSGSQLVASFARTSREEGGLALHNHRQDWKSLLEQPDFQAQLFPGAQALLNDMWD